MLKRINPKSKAFTVALAVTATLVLAGCSSDDDDDDGVISTAANADGTFTFTFTNTSPNQAMTPPILVAHTSVTNGGVDLFETGNAASAEVIAIAEDGNNTPMVDLLTAAQAAGDVSDFAVAVPDPSAPGPLFPGESVTATLTPSDAAQVMSVIAMVICTNDGFTGIDSQAFPAAITSLTAPVYDAGSELNELDVNYWVAPSPCGGTGNLGDEQSGTVALHGGQAAVAGTAAQMFDFAAGDQPLQIDITPN